MDSSKRLLFLSILSVNVVLVSTPSTSKAARPAIVATTSLDIFTCPKLLFSIANTTPLF